MCIRDSGEHVVAELDQMEVIHRHPGLGQQGSDGGAERRRGAVSYTHLDVYKRQSAFSPAGGPAISDRGSATCLVSLGDRWPP